jgi:hypothetical protein
MKRAEGLLPSSASHTSPPPLNFTLAPRNADRIVAPEEAFWLEAIGELPA